RFTMRVGPASITRRYPAPADTVRRLSLLPIATSHVQSKTDAPIQLLSLAASHHPASRPVSPDEPSELSPSCLSPKCANRGPPRSRAASPATLGRHRGQCLSARLATPG